MNRQPILKQNVRILTPEEYNLLISAIPKRKHKLIIQALLHTGCRYAELVRLKENPEWFKDESYLHLPKSAVLKKKARQRERHIILNVFGRDIIKEFLNTSFKMPSRQSLNKNLHRWCIKAGLSPEGICIKTFRKTCVSWLVFVKEEKYLSVLSSIGHDTITSLRHYLSLPFTNDDIAGMKSHLYGWGN